MKRVLEKIPSLLVSAWQSHFHVVNYHYLNAQNQTAFERQLEYFKRHFSLLPTKSLWEDPARLHRGLMVTFDDGYQKVFDYAVPLLRRYQIPATFFVCTDFISENETPTEAWKGFYKNMTGQQRFVDPLMTWGQVRQLLDWGFEIGSHTVTHRKLSMLSSSDLEQELKHSKETLENRLNAPVYTFAIPFGDRGAFNPHVIEAVRNAGYRACFTGVWGINRLPPQAEQLRRESIQPSWETWKLKLLVR
jgi:peptidoglycan/xylan/chitin deacetylase (PgdA/CDA1 family)